MVGCGVCWTAPGVPHVCSSGRTPTGSRRVCPAVCRHATLTDGGRQRRALGLSVLAGAAMIGYCRTSSGWRMAPSITRALALVRGPRRRVTRRDLRGRRRRWRPPTARRGDSYPRQSAACTPRAGHAAHTSAGRSPGVPGSPGSRQGAGMSSTRRYFHTGISAPALRRRCPWAQAVRQGGPSPQFSPSRGPCASAVHSRGAWRPALPGRFQLRGQAGIR